MYLPIFSIYYSHLFTAKSIARVDHSRDCTNFQTNGKDRDGEITQWLRVLVLAEDPGSILCTHMVAHNHP